ncbi:unnamed protein product [Ambrosiozyma monospora]|uniref:Unnamed protein product n=1 Tax=Ambrosiozyma monospora TaxID=43982 RepID=A0A9W6Z372_AMBMO|nr:unnamed protein product [Ambrosiozyma monospora]
MMSSKSTHQQHQQAASAHHQSQTQPKQLYQQLLSLVNTMQFAWFVGHFLTLFFGFLYFSTYYSSHFKGGRLHYLYYNCAYGAIVESFTVIVFESIKSGMLDAGDLIMDDNIQYLSIAICFFWSFPVVSISLCPFLLFSFFHSTNYIAVNLLPLIGLGSHSESLSKFIKKNNDESMYIAAWFEVFTFLYMILKAFTWIEGFFYAAIIYGIFIKLRYEKSIFTRTVFLKVEVAFDGVFAHPALPSFIKATWISLKKGLKNFCNIISVNQSQKDD